jgi:hypothetical protein
MSSNQQVRGAYKSTQQVERGFKSVGEGTIQVPLADEERNQIK